MTESKLQIDHELEDKTSLTSLVAYASLGERHSCALLRAYTRILGTSIWLHVGYLEKPPKHAWQMQHQQTSAGTQKLSSFNPVNLQVLRTNVGGLGLNTYNKHLRYAIIMSRQTFQTKLPNPEPIVESGSPTLAPRTVVF